MIYINKFIGLIRILIDKVTFEKLSPSQSFNIIIDLASFIFGALVLVLYKNVLTRFDVVLIIFIVFFVVIVCMFFTFRRA